MINSKVKGWICQAFNAVLLAGVILFFVGLYYWVIKAGLPYQDPPLELQIQYAVNQEIGNILTKTGGIVALCGGIAQLLFRLLLRKQPKNSLSQFSKK